MKTPDAPANRITPMALAWLLMATALSPIAIGQTEPETPPDATPSTPPESVPSSASNEEAQQTLMQAQNATGVYFEKNMGQWDSQALFRVRGGSVDTFITRTGLVMVQTQAPNVTQSDLRHPRGPPDGDPRDLTNRSSNQPIQRWATRMTLQGSNPNPIITTDAELTYHTNYFLGNDSSKWYTSVSNYRHVTFTSVYPGINLVYHASPDGGLKYDFIVHPGADPARIKQHYTGHSRLNISLDGSLSVQTDLGTIRQGVPLTHQADGTQVGNQYKVSPGGIVSFEIGRYDSNQDLIIDPLVYSTYLGGSDNDYGERITIDGNGNAYIAGIAYSSNFPTTSGAYQTSKSGSDDAFVAKLSSTGSLLYSTYLGGNSMDAGFAIAVDASGNAYITGNTISTNFPLLNAYQTTNRGGYYGYDAFVAKLNSGGNLVYATYLGGSNDDVGRGIAVDASGNAYITGYTKSTNFPLLNAYQTTNRGGSDAFVTKLSSTGNSLVYSTYLGGGGDDYGNDIAVDVSGNAYITGSTHSISFPLRNAYQTTNRGNSNVFVTKLSSTGSSLVYSTYFGGSNSDFGYGYNNDNGLGVAVDESGNAYIAGTTDSRDFPLLNSYKTYHNGDGEEAFAAKFSSTGGLLYSTYLGGSSNDYGYGVAVDVSENAYITGNTGSTDFPLLNAYQTSNQGGGAFVAKLSSTGSLLYSTYLGGSSGDLGHGVAVDGSGNAYITGYTTSTNFPLLNAYQTSNHGGNDAFVTVLHYDTPTPVISGNPHVVGWTTTIPSLSGVSWTDANPGLQSNAQYRIGTTNGGAQIVGWTNFPTQPTPGQTTTWTPTWTPPSLAQGMNYVNTRVKDVLGGTLITNGAYTIQYDSQPPTRPIVSSSTHPDQTKWYSNLSPTFTWTSTDAASGVAGYYYRPPSTSPCPNNLSSSGTWTAGATATFSPLDSFNTYQFCVQPKDNAGILGPMTTFKININTLPPTIQSVTPKDGSNSVSTNQVILVRYNDAKNGWDHDGATVVNASSVQLIADGVDVLAKYRSAMECQPDAVTHDVPASCPIQVDSEHAQYFPPTSWELGIHHLGIRISDTTIPPVTVTLNWTFTQGVPTEPPCGLPPRLGGDAQSVSLPQITPNCFTDELPVPTPLHEIESVVADPANLTADLAHEQDGVPTILQSVYLPSQARNHTTSQDALQLLDGLSNGGLAVLVEPSHHEAWLVVADIKNQTLLSNLSPITGAGALDQIEALQGIQARNALATVLTAGMQVHVQSVPPDVPSIVDLKWSGGALAADGSWLLIHTDPTRTVQLILAGSALPVTPAALSHFSLLTDWRWEFLNLHSGDNFCYDPATTIQATAAACKGNAWPGWIRAFSGQAAYALEAARAGLSGGQIPLTTTPPANLRCMESQTTGIPNPCTEPGHCERTTGVNGSVRVCGLLDAGLCGAGDAGAFVNHHSVCTPLPVPCTDARIGIQPDCHSVTPCPSGIGIQVDASGPCQSVPTACTPPSLGAEPDCHSVTPCPSGIGVQVDAGPCQGVPTACTPPSVGAEPDCHSATPCPSPTVGISPECHTLAACPGGTVGANIDGSPLCLPTHLQCIGIPCGSPQSASTGNSASPPGMPTAEPESLRESQSSSQSSGVFAAQPASGVQQNPPRGGGSGDSSGGNSSNPPSQASNTSSSRLLPAIPHVKLPLMDAGSKWQLLGNNSYAFQTGIGIDYLLDPTGSLDTGSLVQQVTDASLTSPTIVPSPLQRLFKFEGAYYETPASPRNLVSIRLGIQNMDGIDKAQSFAINGKRLAELLDVQTGETLNVTIDQDHKEGFQYAVRDINNDGIADLIVHVPHFSQAWMDIHNDQNFASWRHVKMTGPSTGWLTGAGGAVYRYSSGSLTRYDVSGPSGSIRSDQATTGLFVLSDTDFYVVGGCSRDTTPPFIAHYHSTTLSQSAFTLMPVPSNLPCNSGLLKSIWMNSAGTTGYAGGQSGLWLKYNGAQWVRITNPTTCDINVIQFDSTGRGLLGLLSGDYCSTVGSILSYNGVTFTNVADSSARADIQDILGPSESWATGASCQGGSPTICSNVDMGIYQLISGTWKLTRESGAPNNPMGGVDKASTDSYWFVGWGGNCGCATIANRQGGTWSSKLTYSNLARLADVSFGDASAGLAVGDSNAVLQYRDESPAAEGEVSSPDQEPPQYQPPPPQYSPDAEATVTAYGDTNTVITADGSGSSSRNGNTLTHYWSWGDTAGTFTGQTVSHRYNDPGTYIVEHWVVDNGNGLSSEHQRFGVAIVSEPFGIPASVSNSISNGGSPQSHHYLIPATSGDRYVQFQLACPQHTVRVFASLNSVVLPPGNWPSRGWPACAPGSNTVVASRIPSGQSLDIMVQSPQDNYVGSIAYTLTSSVVASPAPWTLNVNPGTVYSNPLGIVATSLATGRATYALIDWGDGTPTTRVPAWGYATAGQATSYPALHSYASAGTYTVSVNSVDDLGQASTSSQSSQATVHTLPAGSAGGAINILATQADLTGSVTSLGGAGSVTATYRLYNGPSTSFAVLATSNPSTVTQTGSLANFHVTGLKAGTTYAYTVTLTNDVAGQRIVSSQFQTQPDLSILPQRVNDPGTSSLGSAYSLQLQPGGTQNNQVAYYVRWDPGVPEARYPADSNDPPTTWTSQNSPYTVSNTYAFAGSHTVEAHMQDTTLGRSGSITWTTTVTGAPPISSFTSTSTLSTVTLRAVVGSFGASCGSVSASLMFTIRLPGASTGYTSPLNAVCPGQIVTWTSPALDPAQTYQAFVTLTAGSGESWTTPAESVLGVQTNRLQTLQAGSTPGMVNYLDSTRFAVTYQDAEGDYPANSGGAAAAPQLLINGQTYTLYPSTDSPDYHDLEYYYNLPSSALLQGQSNTPTYRVWDQFQRQVTVTGPSVFIAAQSLLSLDFNQDAVGSVPQGMALGGEKLNFWHVTDTQSKNMTGRVALGHHGKAVWFADPNRGTYKDPDGQAAYGTLVMSPMDLRQIISPSLSFSSYYETRTGPYDLKTVEMRTQGNTGAWSQWSKLKTVGYDGTGYGTWRTQHLDLANYADQIVQFRFVFKAVTNPDAAYLGWLIDDISLGHDHDLDALPDALENTRIDTRIFDQLSPVEIRSGGNSGEGYVRRVNRPLAQALHLKALVSSPHLDNVNVWLGVSGTASNPAHQLVEIYHQGAILASCTVDADGITYTASGRQSVIKRSDGLDILFDLKNCPTLLNAFKDDLSDQRNWILRVDDTAATGSGSSWIEFLQVVSLGRTSPLQADTNRDSTEDGVEVDRISDPLAVDADQDSINKKFDLDDQVPNWLPFVGFGTWTNGGNGGPYVEFKDILVPIAKVTMVAETDEGDEVLSMDSYPQVRYSTFWSPGPLPSAVRVEFQDAYGTRGVYRFTLSEDSQDGALLSGMQGSAHGANGEFAIGPLLFPRAVADVGVAGQATAEAVATAWGTGSRYGTRIITTVSNSALAGVSLAAGVVFFVLLAPETGDGGSVAQYAQQAQAGAVATVEVNPLLGSMILTEAAWASMQGYDAAHRLTLDELRDAMKTATENAAATGGMYRWFKTVGTTVITFTTLGNQVVDGFKLILPTAVSWAEPTVALAEKNFLYLEQQVGNYLGQATALGDLLLRNFANPLFCLSPRPVSITQSTPGLQEAETPEPILLPLPKCVHDAWVAGLVAIDEASKYAPRQGFIDTPLGQGVFGLVKTTLQDTVSPKDIKWYWDDNAPEPTDCSQPYTSWHTAEVRRCNPYEVAGPFSPETPTIPWDSVTVSTRPEMVVTAGTVAWPSLNLFKVPEGYTAKDVILPDFLAVTELDWQKQPSGDGHVDAFASKGIIVSGQAIQRGKDYLEATRDLMVARVPVDIELVDADAFTTVEYAVTDVYSVANVDYRSTPL